MVAGVALTAALALLYLLLCRHVVSARNFNCARPMINQVGIGASAAPLCPNPLYAVNLTAPCKWPIGFVTGVQNMYFGGVFDGTDLWMAPAAASAYGVARINRTTGNMTLYNAWPANLTLGIKSFFGAVFDGEDIWLAPHEANGFVRVNRTTGNMTLYNAWPAGFVRNSLIFVGGVYDGDSIWGIPYDANGLVKLNRTSGNMTLYNAWPSNLTLTGGNFGGAVFDGDFIWLVPRSVNGLVRFNRTSGNMTLYKSWPSGLTGFAFFGGAFDGRNSIWLVPHGATNGVVRVDRTTGNMTLFMAWPPGTGSGFLSAAFDGLMLWMVPDTASGVVRLDTSSGNMSRYNNWPTNVTTPTYPFSGAIFDGQSIWLTPRNSNAVVKIESGRLTSITFTDESSLSSTGSRVESTSASATTSLTSHSESRTSTRSFSRSHISATWSFTRTSKLSHTASIATSYSFTETCSQSVTRSRTTSGASRTGHETSSTSPSRDTVTESDSCGALSALEYEFFSVPEASAIAPLLTVGSGSNISTWNPSSRGNTSANETSLVLGVFSMAEAVAAKSFSVTLSLAHPLAALASLNSSVTTTFGSIRTVEVHSFVPPRWDNTSLQVMITITVPQTNLLYMMVSTLAVVRIPREVLLLYPQCGRLRMLPAGLEAAIELLPLKPPVLTRSGQTAVTSTAIGAGAVSALAGNPVVAMQQGTMLALSDISVCAFSDVEELGSGAPMLDIGFGSDVGQYYRGAIVGFIGVVLGLGVLLGAVVEVIGFAASRTKQGRRSHNSARCDVAAIAHYPSILIIPFVCFFQGALISAVSLLRLQLSVSDMVLAGLAMIFTFSGIGLALAVTKPWFECVEGSRVRETPLDI